MPYQEAWVVFPLLVDNAPAMLMVDTGHARAEQLPTEASTHLVIDLEMVEPDEHGMGTQSEVARVTAFDDWLSDASKKVGAHYVARLRNKGNWQWSIFCSASAAESLEASAKAAALLDVAFRKFDDPTWDYYQTFLMPSPERQRYIADRGVVMQLLEAGDNIEAPRPVEHFIRFSAPLGLAAFKRDAERLGFGIAALQEGLGVKATRSDPVELGHIHGVTLELEALAERHDGVYEGWGAGVVR